MKVTVDPRLDCCRGACQRKLCWETGAPLLWETVACREAGRREGGIGGREGGRDRRDGGWVEGREGSNGGQDQRRVGGWVHRRDGGMEGRRDGGWVGGRQGGKGREERREERSKPKDTESNRVPGLEIRQGCTRSSVSWDEIVNQLQCLPHDYLEICEAWVTVQRM